MKKKYNSASTPQNIVVGNIQFNNNKIINKEELRDIFTGLEEKMKNDLITIQLTKEEVSIIEVWYYRSIAAAFAAKEDEELIDKLLKIKEVFKEKSK